MGGGGPMAGAGRNRRGAWAVALLCGLTAGCSIGPKVLQCNRLRYNEGVKTSAEEELLLNIVRLRYTDTPSSLQVTNIAAQYELVKRLQLVPFFAASGDVVPQSFSTVLPQAEVNVSDRPTLSLTPQDDHEFTRRLFTPLPLEGIVYLSRTTWPISTVFRLWLENLNWVSNAETASGPTPRQPPVFEDFLRGVEALERLQDRKGVTFFTEEREESLGEGLPAAQVGARDLVEAAKAGYEYKNKGDGTWTLIRKKSQPILRVSPDFLSDPDLIEFCQAFRLRPGLATYELTADKLDPYLANAPPEGLSIMDLESRSLLQVLFFLAHGVQVPPEHLANGTAPVTLEPDGQVFDWDRVLRGLFRVCRADGCRRPPHAHVAVRHGGYWFYIDERDRDTKATFSLVLELSRLELTAKTGPAPVLTLPLGGR